MTLGGERKGTEWTALKDGCSDLLRLDAAGLNADLGVPHAGLQNLRNQSLTASHVELIVPFSAIVDFQ